MVQAPEFHHCERVSGDVSDFVLPTFPLPRANGGVSVCFYRKKRLDRGLTAKISYPFYYGSLFTCLFKNILVIGWVRIDFLRRFACYFWWQRG